MRGGNSAPEDEVSFQKSGYIYSILKKSYGAGHVSATPPPPPSLFHLPLEKFFDFMERKLVKDSKQFLDEKN